MQQIKYIFFDLDGTLLNDDKSISEKTVSYLDEIKRNTRVRLGIASGRAFQSIMNILKKSQIINLFDYIISNNGADVCYLRSGQNKVIDRVQKNTILDILHSFAHFDSINVAFHNDQTVFATKHNARVRKIVEANSSKWLKNPLCDDFDVSARVMLLLEDISNLEVLEKIKTINFTEVKGMFSERDIFEYIPRDVSKLNTIKSVVLGNGDELANVLTFGDSENDLEMVNMVELGVWMKNSPNYLRLDESYITETDNNNEGHIEFIKKNYDKLFTF